MQESITNAIMNFLLVSLPEESIWLISTLILMKRFDLLDKYMWKDKIKYLALPVFLSSISINFLKYIIVAPRLVISISAILTIYVGIIYILKIPENNMLNEKIPYFKILFYVLLNLAGLIILVEYLYAPIFLIYIKKSIIEINYMWNMNFLLSIPARVIQFFIIIIILIIQNKKTYVNIMQSIFSDKKITITVTSFISILIIFWIILIDIFGKYNIMSQFKINQQIILNILLLIVPSILLMLMIYLIVLFIEQINRIQMSHRNMFDDILDDDINY